MGCSKENDGVSELECQMIATQVHNPADAIPTIPKALKIKGFLAYLEPKLMSHAARIFTSLAEMASC
jgi:hypothetical protein